MEVTVEKLVAMLEVCNPVIRAKYANRIRVLGHRFDTDDLCQVVAIKAVRYLPRFVGDTDAQLAKWIYAIAHNACEEAVVEHNRAKRSFVREEVAIGCGRDDHQDGFLPAGSDHTPDVQAEINEETEAMMAAIETIPAQQAVAVRMRYLENRPYDEIAETMGVSNDAVRLLVSRGIKSVRSAMNVCC